MFKPAYQVAVLYSPIHPEQEINLRYRPLMTRNKNKETIWEFESKPCH